MITKVSSETSSQIPQILTPQEFYAELTASAEKFISPEVQEAFRQARILIAGAGSVGNPIAMMAIRSGAEAITVADPDIIEVSNLPRQEYSWWQTGRNKAQMTALNMRLINPYASKTIESVRDGITAENVTRLVEDARIIVDAIDIRALDMIYLLHKNAAIARKPVIVGYDLAGTAMVAVYRYDKKKMEPLNGELNESTIEEFKKVRKAYMSGSILEGDFLDYIYNVFTGPINPFDVPVEQLEELINRKEGDTRTYQIGTTSRILSALTIETIRRIHEGIDVKNRVVVDLPSEVRKRNPSILTMGIMMLKAYIALKIREEKVKTTLTNLN